MVDSRVLVDEDEKFERAEELLASNVLPSEHDELMSQRYELNAAILWKRVEETCFKNLLEFVEEMLFQPTDFSKVLPISNLFDEGAFLDDVEGGEDRKVLRHHFLALQAAKKILGILKSRVNKELEALQTINPEQELKLLEIVDSAVYKESSTSNKDEDVIALPPPKSKTPPEEEDMGEIIVSAKVKGKKPEKDCPHSHTRRTYRKDAQGLTHEEVFCKMCDVWLSEEELTPLTAHISKKPKDCRHSSAQWVPGKEGKVAQCGEPECGFILKKAHTYRWREAGLEPFGDDPSKDEVLFFGGKEMGAKA